VRWRAVAAPDEPARFSHLFEVDAIEPVLERVLRAAALDASRIPPAVFVTDPDGTRIELVPAAEPLRA
jgi:hypothetical protein